jgi:hypothetical protein
MLPVFAVDDKDPMLIGEAKLPDAFDNCTVKLFPVFAGPSPL